MNSKIYNLFISFLMILGMVSCSDSGTVMHKNITGKAGEMVVVMSKDLWNKRLAMWYAKLLLNLSWRCRRTSLIFDLINVPQAAFTSVFKSTRNVLQTSISQSVDKEGITFNDDIWAYPQAAVKINAKNPDQFVKFSMKIKTKLFRISARPRGRD